MDIQVKEKFADFLKDGRAPFDYGRILINNYKDRLLSYFNKENPIPYEIEIQPSPKCNAYCDHCWAKKFKRLEDNLSKKENADRIIEQVLNFKDEDFSLPKIKFCGSTGEPLVNPLTPYYLENFYGKRKMRLFTNGIKIGENRFDKNYLTSLAKLDGLYLSLDAGTTETLWKIKKGARMKNVSIEEILEGTRRIKEINGTHVNVSYVITNKNYEDILKATEKSKIYGLDLIRFRIDLTETYIPPKRLNEIIEFLKIAKNFENENFKVVPIHSEEEIKEKNKCNFGTKKLGIKCYTNAFWTCIGSDGKIYPCGHIANPYVEDYGDLLKEDFKDIWNGEKRKRVIETLPGEYCSICSPFSKSTNIIMSFLSELKNGEVKELVKDAG